MLRLSPPALTAGLRQPLGVGFPFRSGVQGFRHSNANGFRLRTNRKFMIYFPYQTIYHTVFSQKHTFGRCYTSGEIACTYPFL